MDEKPVPIDFFDYGNIYCNYPEVDFPDCPTWDKSRYNEIFSHKRITINKTDYGL